MAIEIISRTRAKLIVEVGTGKHRKRKTKTVTYSGKRDLERQYREFEDKVKHNPLIDVSVEDLVSSYIDGRKVLGIKDTTLNGYRNEAKRIYNRFEGIQAAELTPYHIQDFITDMKEGKTDEKKKYSAKTIANTITLLSSAYENAVRLGQLSRNPCKLVQLPKKDAPEIDIFADEQIVVFLDALKSQRRDYSVGYKLALFCGLRRSEILGLREEHINISFKTLTVTETRHKVKGEDVVQTPKTKKSARTLAIPDALVREIAQLIWDHHNLQYEHTDYLIQDGFGQPMSPSALTTQIYRIEESCGLPPVSLHDLRHTFTSMLNSKGVDIARISAELGHSNISTTLNIYTHVFGDASASSRGIADTLNSVLENPATDLPPEEKKKA